LQNSRPIGRYGKRRRRSEKDLKWKRKRLNDLKWLNVVLPKHGRRTKNGELEWRESDSSPRRKRRHGYVARKRGPGVNEKDVNETNAGLTGLGPPNGRSSDTRH
jgi:hypothetical protein